ncbi:ABC transporter permease [Halobacterium jilantaiense]|uniref:ABC-2 type transport system permease protein n=1 Tax=Halobacterium jilantaiense TaxID=355548 RepID=A0A1I0PQD6_9EURY|nr:ABC transporter permease [Halobacterium jilantaiense]SEW16503.1 ABC-2 type transport system permease protein [Halobacterium jilantaiense]
MSWTAIARKDFQDASRSKALWALTALFVLFMAGMAYVFTLVGDAGAGELDTVRLLSFLIGPVTLLIPLTALVMAHKAVASEVESGSAKFLLSLPHTRRDTVVGKVVGRSAVMGVAVLVGLVVAAIVVLGLYDAFDAMAYLGFSVLSLLLAAVFTAIGVGLSAMTKDTGRATILAAGFYIVFEVIWGVVSMGIHYLLNGSFFPMGTPPDWYLLLNRIPPSSAFTTAVYRLLPGDYGVMASYFPDSAPFFLSEWAALVILLAWLVAVPAIGYWRFQAADL